MKVTSRWGWFQEHTASSGGYWFQTWQPSYTHHWQPKSSRSIYKAKAKSPTYITEVLNVGDLKKKKKNIDVKIDANVWQAANWLS